MIVNVKRKELLAQAKRVARAVPGVHAIKELSGIMFESDGRTGIVRMTATNLSTAIRSALPAVIERGGGAVINARLFLSILERLPGENVYMELMDNGQLFIRSERAKFHIVVMSDKNYPKVEIPFPDDMVSIKGLKSLIARSVFAVAHHGTGNPELGCVKLVFSETGVRAIGCDGTCAVQAKGDPECKGAMSMLIPADSLRLLASIAGDGDVYELGVTGSNGTSKNVVVSDGITTFSARLMDGTYLDTDVLFKNIVPAASAYVEAEKLYRTLEHVWGLASAGDRVEFSFRDGDLILRCDSDNGIAAARLDAEVALATDNIYYHIPKNIINCAKILRGGVTLNFTKDGTLELRTEDMRFLQVPARPKIKKEPRKKAA